MNTLNREDILQVILHHSATPFCTANFAYDKIKMYHLNRGYEDIGYHFLIDYGGVVRSGRNYIYQGAHCYGHNKNSIGVCFIGNYNENELSAHQLHKFYLLLRKLEDYAGRKLSVDVHRSYRNTSCPGDALVRQLFGIKNSEHDTFLSNRLFLLSDYSKLCASIR